MFFIVVWTDLVNVTATGNSIQKTAGCDGCQDAGAASQQQIVSGDGYVEFTATETNTTRAAGLGNGNTDATAADIDYAIALWNDGLASVYERGVFIVDLGPYTTGTVVRVAVEGGPESKGSCVGSREKGITKQTVQTFLRSGAH